MPRGHCGPHAARAALWRSPPWGAAGAPWQMGESPGAQALGKPQAACSAARDEAEAEAARTDRVARAGHETVSGHLDQEKKSDDSQEWGDWKADDADSHMNSWQACPNDAHNSSDCDAPKTVQETAPHDNDSESHTWGKRDIDGFEGPPEGANGTICETKGEASQSVGKTRIPVPKPKVPPLKLMHVPLAQRSTGPEKVWQGDESANAARFASRTHGSAPETAGAFRIPVPPPTVPSSRRLSGTWKPAQHATVVQAGVGGRWVPKDEGDTVREAKLPPGPSPARLLVEQNVAAAPSTIASGKDLFGSSPSTPMVEVHSSFSRQEPAVTNGNAYGVWQNAPLSTLPSRDVMPPDNPAALLGTEVCLQGKGPSSPLDDLQGRGGNHDVSEISTRIQHLMSRIDSTDCVRSSSSKGLAKGKSALGTNSTRTSLANLADKGWEAELTPSVSTGSPGEIQRALVAECGLASSDFAEEHHFVYRSGVEYRRQRGGELFEPPPRGSVKLALSVAGRYPEDGWLDRDRGWPVAYHGTNAKGGTLASIVRKGLRIRGGADAPRVGERYGTGVYVSPDPHVAATFCDFPLVLRASKYHSKSLHVVVQCRVRPNSFLRTAAARPTWLVAREDHVRPCGLLFITSSLVLCRHQKPWSSCCGVGKASEPVEPKRRESQRSGRRRSRSRTRTRSRSPSGRRGWRQTTRGRRDRSRRRRRHHDRGTCERKRDRRCRDRSFSSNSGGGASIAAPSGTGSVCGGGGGSSGANADATPVPAIGNGAADAGDGATDIGAGDDCCCENSDGTVTTPSF